MADETGRLVKFVAKLNRMTQEGRIEWRLIDPPEYLTSDASDKIPFYFVARINNQYLGLYILRYHDSDSYHNEPFWSEKTVLAFCAPDWTPIWEFPPIAGIDELLESVQRQYVRVDSFIDEFLAEDDK
jgi:hypothetical protein